MRLVTLYAWMVLASLTPSLSAQTGPATNATIRVLSREECIRLALEHDLSIQIARHNPIIAQLALKGSYGAYYEPSLSVGGEHRYSREETTVQSGSLNVYTNTRTFASLTDVVSGVNSNSSTTDSWRRTKADSIVNAGSQITATTPIGTTLGLGGRLVQNNIEGGSTVSGGGQDANTALVTPNSRLINSSSSGYSQDAWVGLTVVQPLLKDFWTDPGRTQIQLNKKSLKMSEYDLEWQVMTVVAQVQKAYYNLIAARDAVKVTEKALELARQLLAETQKKVQVGVATPLDEKQVESQVATSTANLIEARRFQSLQENQLKTFLTDDYGQWYNVSPVPSEQLIAVPEAYDLNESWLRGIALRPDFNRLKTDVEKQGLVVQLQRNQVYPQLNFVGSIGKTMYEDNQHGATSSFLQQFDPNLGQTTAQSTLSTMSSTRRSTPEYGVGLLLTVPLGGNISARTQLQIARETQKLLQETVRFEHMKLLVQIEDALKMVKAKHEQVGAFREARIFARAAYDAEVKKYENGKSTSFFVLDFQNRLTRAAADEIRALADYNTALVDFHLAEGSTLERNLITVNYK